MNICQWSKKNIRYVVLCSIYILVPPDIVAGGDKIHIPWIDLKDLLPLETSLFYRYDGSLTTPTCDQTVIWSVFAEKQRISRRQVGIVLQQKQNLFL